MSLVEYLRTLIRHWPLIVVLALVGGGAGYLMAAHETPMYRSTSSVLLASEFAESTSELVQGSTYVSNLVDSYVRVAGSELVLGPVVDELDLDITPRQLATQVSVSSPLNTLVLDISVVDSNPDQAQEIAASVTEHLRAATAIVSPGSGDAAAVRLTTISEAGRPSAPFSPNTRLTTAMGLALGGALGVGIALTRRLYGTTISNATDVQGVTTLPVVGEIIEAKSSMSLSQTVLDDPLSREAESLRSLTANLRFLSVGHALKTFVITSAAPGEGKSSVASGTAVALAESADRVLLIDGDLRSPTIAESANLDNAVGLSDVLVGSVTLEEAAQSWSDSGLDVLTSGTTPPNPAQLLSSDAMKKLVERASASYDFVVIDSPPLLLVTDALWLSHITDGTLLVARRGKSTTRALSRVLSVLETAPVAGVIISRMPRTSKAEYGANRRALKTRRRSRRRAER